MDNKYDIEPYTIEHLIWDLKNKEYRPCHVCGKMTDNEYFGYPCCDVEVNGCYDDRCKAVLRDIPCNPDTSYRDRKDAEYREYLRRKQCCNQ